MHHGITQWRCLHRVLRKYINNTKSLVKLFFSECLWLSVGFILTRPSFVFQSTPKKIVVSRLHLSIYLFVCSKENVVSCLHLYIFSSIPKKNVVFITSRTRNGRMSITVQYITILSQTVGQCNVIVFTKINRFIQFQAGGQKLQKKTNYLFLSFYVWPKALLYCKQ